MSRREYDLDGRLAAEVLPLEHARRGAFAQGYRYTYDRAGRHLQATAPGGILYERNTYDAAGNVIRDIDGAAYGFDLSGRRTSVTTPEGSSQTFAYDASGNLTCTTDSMGYTTRFQTDAWGRVTLVTRADGSHERYTYDHAGNILTATDGEGHTASYAYNCRGLLSTRTDAMGASEHFRYDREGNMVESTDRNGVRLTLTYNMYQSLTGRRSMDGGISEHFGYYPDGKLKYAISSRMRYDYTYDAMGRLAGKSAGGRSLVAYTYDVGGNRTGLTDLTGKRTEYEYDYADRLRKVYDNGNCQACYTYNPDGTMKALEIGGNSGEGVLYTEYSYDRDKNLTGLKTLVRQGALTGRYGVLTDNHYSYDRAGNCVIRQTLSGETRYSYDSLYQLTEASCPNKKEQFTYDRAGNRLTRTVARTHGDTVREAYTYDNANRLTRRSTYNMTAGAQEIPETPEMADRIYRYTYDRQGNMLSDGDNTYQYDGMNRLKEINTKAGDIQKNHYDGEGLRAELEENGKLVSFLFSDGEAVLEDSEAAGITRYIRGLGLLTSDSESARTYYHYASDELGSITHITDEEGNVLNRYEYDAFGNFTVKEETIPNRFAFTGEQYDPITSQYYLRARFYNPVIGRFLNEDTYYGDGLNLYTYCHNNPVEYVDPSGNWCKKKFKQKVKEYLEKGYSKKDAKVMANYEQIRENYDVNSAEQYLRAVLDYENLSPEAWKSIDQFRESHGLNTLGNGLPKKGDGTVAFINANGEKIFGINSSLLSEDKKMLGKKYYESMKEAGYFDNVTSYGNGSGQVFTHAEGNSLMSVYDLYGKSIGKDITIFCDRTTCGICKNNLGYFKDYFGIDSLTVLNKNGDIVIINKGTYIKIKS